MPHVMAVTITFPPALHSIDAIPAFDVEDAELEDVGGDHKLLAMDPPSDAWQPGVDAGAEPSLWTRVPAMWAAPTAGESGRAAVISSAAKMLGWKTVGSWQKAASVPRKFVTGFKDNAFACPMMAKGM